jgi:hypothetical protein
LLNEDVMATKAICFKCRFVAIGLSEARCPVCAYPLISNTESVALGAQDIDRLFERKESIAAFKAPPLPGVSAEPRAAQLLIQRRRARAEKLLEQKKRIAARYATRRKILASAAVASAAIGGLFATLLSLGAL